MTYQTARGSVNALAGVDLRVDAGDFLSIVGPSGCGKTTLLDLIAGFQHPTSGSVYLSGQTVTDPDRDRCVVFQQPALLPWMSVVDNVTFGPRLRGTPRLEREAIARPLLILMGLQDFADHRTYELSAGMQQRVSIARALANEPEILLMDEPFAALDAFTRDAMQENLLKVWRDTRTTIVFVTHSVEEAIFLGTRVAVMSARPGRLVADWPMPFSRLAGVEVDERAVRAQREFGEARLKVLDAVMAQAPNGNGTPAHNGQRLGAPDPEEIA